MKDSETINLPRLLKISEVMEALSVSRRYVEMLIEDGTLQTKRIGKNDRWVRVTKQSFDAYYDSL